MDVTPTLQCHVCLGQLDGVRDSEQRDLPPGLYKVVNSMAPVRVPAGETWALVVRLMRCTHCSTYFNHVVLKHGDTIMTSKAIPASADDAKKPNRKELLEKVRRLSESIEDTTAAKKAAAKDYGEELKALKDELHDTLENLKNTPEQG